jgi:DNA-binding SARP family transcriptional activator
MAMKAYLGLNNAAHALQVYQALEDTLRKELDVQPGAALRALAAEIRQR